MAVTAGLDNAARALFVLDAHASCAESSTIGRDQPRFELRAATTHVESFDTRVFGRQAGEDVDVLDARKGEPRAARAHFEIVAPRRDVLEREGAADALRGRRDPIIQTAQARLDVG